MAEEILNALAKVKDLKVAGRSSSFSYKGKEQDLRTMGQALGVANILEGSVRKQGDKVRITAQLIQTEDGFHLWSETYDGDLSDVFELQERIARAITGELRTILSGDQQQRLVPVATDQPVAYGLYLQATSAFNRRDAAKFPDMIAQLEQALGLDPKFARAHARLASVQAIRRVYIPTDTAAASMAVETHAAAASALDPSLAEPFAALGYSRWLQRRRIPSFEAFERALALDPRDPTANYWFAVALLQGGYEKRATEMLDRVLQIDPMHGLALEWRGFRHYYAGEFEAARRNYLKAAELGLSYAGHGLAHLAAEEGRPAEATTHMASAMRVYGFVLPPGPDRILAAGMFGDADARAEAMRWIDAYLAEPHDVVSSVVPWVLLELGAPDRALDLLRAAPTTNDAISFNVMWSPRGTAARTSAGFPEFARAIGLADLWDRYGAPDRCTRIAPGNYRCE